jgi:DNA-directed RNA polymerase
MLKQLSILNAATDPKSPRTTKNTARDSSETTAAVTATTGEEKEAGAENENDAVLDERATSPSPTVSVVSKEQALELLIPTRHEQAAATRKRSRSGSKSTPVATADGNGNAEAETETESGDPCLEGKFVNLVDLLLPVPIKGEFDVNKIKSSLYFFS